MSAVPASRRRARASTAAELGSRFWSSLSVTIRQAVGWPADTVRRAILTRAGRMRGCGSTVVSLIEPPYLVASISASHAPGGQPYLRNITPMEPQYGRDGVMGCVYDALDGLSLPPTADGQQGRWEAVVRLDRR